MKGLVYGGPGKRSWDDIPDARVQDPRDAVIRIDAVTICGTDLHILGGDVPEVTPGRVLGHEAVGTVEEVGSGVGNLSVGDRVLASCISSCGVCRYCREGAYGQCRNGGGWILGHLVDGVQAEYARIPFADLSTYKLPAQVSNETAVLLADILPTSYEVGVLNGRVRPGDTVVVVGTGLSVSRPSSPPGCSPRRTSWRSTRRRAACRLRRCSAPTSPCSRTRTR